MDCFVATLLAMTWKCSHSTARNDVETFYSTSPAPALVSAPVLFTVIASAAKQSIAQQKKEKNRLLRGKGTSQ